MKTFEAMVSRNGKVKAGTYHDMTLCDVTGMIKRVTDLVIPDEILEKVTYMHFENPMLTIKNNTRQSGIAITIELIPVGGIHNKKGGFYDEEYYQITLFWRDEHKSLNFQEESKDVAASLQWMFKCVNVEALV
jgi:hypothetical protein